MDPDLARIAHLDAVIQQLELEPPGHRRHRGRGLRAVVHRVYRTQIDIVRLLPSRARLARLVAQQRVAPAHAGLYLERLLATSVGHVAQGDVGPGPERAALLAGPELVLGDRVSAIVGFRPMERERPVRRAHVCRAHGYVRPHVSRRFRGDGREVVVDGKVRERRGLDSRRVLQRVRRGLRVGDRYRLAGAYVDVRQRRGPWT